MSSPPSSEAISDLNTEPSLSDYYEDDLSEDSVLISPFAISIGTKGQLSSGSSKSSLIDPSSTCDEEGDTYAELISHTRVRAALKRPVRLCRFYSVPTCLLILEIELFETKHFRQLSRLLRFKSVDVTVEFKDAAGVPTMGPEVVMLCPEIYNGEATTVTHYRSTTLGARIDTSNSIPIGPHLSAQRSQATQFTRNHRSSILGRALRMGSKTSVVNWEIKEDETLREGVPKQLRFVMAVKNPDERAFIMKLNFSAYLGFNNVEFRVKKKQAILSTKVDPVVLRELALNDENGPEHGRVWQCLADDVDLATIRLEELTNLEGATVGRTIAFG